jgi:hypothetical protein
MRAREASSIGGWRVFSLQWSEETDSGKEIEIADNLNMTTSVPLLPNRSEAFSGVK